MDKHNGKYILTHSLLTTFKLCHRKHYLSQVKRLTLKVTPTPWVTGKALHRGVELFYRRRSLDEMVEGSYKVFNKAVTQAKGFLTPEQVQTLDVQKAMVEGMLIGYSKIYRSDLKKFQVLDEPEKQFYIPIRHPETKEEHPHFVYGGVIDLPFRKKKEQFCWIKETKTAAQVDKEYMSRVALDTQITGYMLGALSLFKMPVKGVLYDIVKKCMLRQKQGESFPSYCRRVTDDYISRPDFYYIREEIRRAKADIDAFKSDLWMAAEDLHHIMQKELYHRNAPAACMMYHMPCQFIPICILGNADITPVLRFYRQKSKGSEELRPANDSDDDY